MSSVSEYFSGLFKGIKSLLTGMGVTGKEFVAKKVTFQYPENRDKLVISPRFRAELSMPHDENNEHACTACGICQMNCPNGTIKVISRTVETEDGKKKKVLDKYTYDIGMCTFCNLCVVTCPSDAIVFTNQFENAMFRREGLKQTLNKEGSKLREKKKETKPAADKPAPKVEAKAEAAVPKVEKVEVKEDIKVEPKVDAEVKAPQAPIVETKPIVEAPKADEPKEDKE